MIGEEEERQDQRVQSSFHPCDFKPTKFNADRFGDVPETASHQILERTDSGNIIATHCASDVSKSSRFLPCHYFSYGAGTSTGG